MRYSTQTKRHSSKLLLTLDLTNKLFFSQLLVHPLEPLCSGVVFYFVFIKICALIVLLFRNLVT